MTATSWLKLLPPVDVTEEERETWGSGITKASLIFSRSSQAKQYVALDLSVILVAVGVLFFVPLWTSHLAWLIAAALSNWLKAKATGDSDLHSSQHLDLGESRGALYIQVRFSTAGLSLFLLLFSFAFVLLLGSWVV